MAVCRGTKSLPLKDGILCQHTMRQKCASHRSVTQLQAIGARPVSDAGQQEVRCKNGRAACALLMMQTWLTGRLIRGPRSSPVLMRNASDRPGFWLFCESITESDILNFSVQKVLFTHFTLIPHFGGMFLVMLFFEVWLALAVPRQEMEERRFPALMSYVLSIWSCGSPCVETLHVSVSLLISKEQTYCFDSSWTQCILGCPLTIIGWAIRRVL